MAKELCSICGEMAAQRAPYCTKNHSVNNMKSALWCNSCNKGVISPRDNKATALEIQEHRSRIDGIPTPSEITKIRENLNLNQKDASRLSDGGINSFNRYKRRTNPIPKPLSMLLVLLDKHSEQLNVLLMSQIANPSEHCARPL